MDPAVKQESLKEQVLFWITAFFVLLATFSLFAFLFLVPFFIEPAMTTIALEFDPVGTTCFTVSSAHRRGQTHCKWSSCKEGCTKEVFECWHIRVQYVGPRIPEVDDVEHKCLEEDPIIPTTTTEPETKREKAVIIPSLESLHNEIITKNKEMEEEMATDDQQETVEDIEEKVKAYFGEIEPGYVLRTAKLFPNVKGCGYPPDIQCSEFYETYGILGKNFTCYYSPVEPHRVITHLDMDKVFNNLVYCLTIPIISFVISVIYLCYAYFYIYNEDPTPQVVITAADTEDVDETAVVSEGKEILMSLNRDGLLTLKPVGDDVVDLVIVNNAKNQVHLSNSLNVMKTQSGDLKPTSPVVTPNGQIPRASDVPCRESLTSRGTDSPSSSVFSEEEETQPVR